MKTIWSMALVSVFIQNQLSVVVILLFLHLRSLCADKHDANQRFVR